MSLLSRLFGNRGTKSDKSAEKPSKGLQRYSVSPEGVITDSNNGMQWVVGPDLRTTYDGAEEWVKNCRIAGGGWRMPTRAELRCLRVKDVNTTNIDPIFKTTGRTIWAEPKEAGEGYEPCGWCLRFIDGWETLRGRSYYDEGTRAFGVRSIPQPQPAQSRAPSKDNRARPRGQNSRGRTETDSKTERQRQRQRSSRQRGGPAAAEQRQTDRDSETDSEQRGRRQRQTETEAAAAERGKEEEAETAATARPRGREIGKEGEERRTAGRGEERTARRGTATATARARGGRRPRTARARRAREARAQRERRGGRDSSKQQRPQTAAAGEGERERRRRATGARRARRSLHGGVVFWWKCEAVRV